MIGIQPAMFTVGTMSDNDFARFSEYIQTEFGIKLPPTKKTMLESRLLKRMRKLGIKSFNEYSDYVFKSEDKELEIVYMVDEVTTNKTEFFREPRCFKYMLEKAIPGLIRTQEAGIRRRFRVWSAACASGEEPYTLAMILSNFAERHPADFKASILATDISTKMLKIAKRAVYGQEEAELVPEADKRKYLMVSRKKERGLVRIVPELRSLVQFGRLNLMDEDFGIKERQDIIFCRNVMIYFDRARQEKLLNRFCRHLTPGGYIIVGQSEMIMNMDVPLVQVAPMIYRKKV